MPTDKLYLHDSYITEFQAEIIDIVFLENSRWAVILDRTAFYPEGGGQPADQGWINGIPVVDVQEADGQIHHIVESAPACEPAQAKLNWQRRFDHMQQHTGQHILSAAFDELFGASTIGFHLGALSSQIDLALSTISQDDLRQVENLANEVIFTNRPILVHEATQETLSHFPLRKQPAKNFAEIRLVSVDDFDCCPCGGTHTTASGEVGLIKIKAYERKNNAIRIDFVCGWRALRDYQIKNETLQELSCRLSAPAAELPAALDKQLAKIESLNKELADTKQALLAHKANILIAQSEPFGSARLVIHTIHGISPQEASFLARHITATEKMITLLAGINTEGTKVHLIFACSADLSLNMGEPLRAALPAVDGKGGGKGITTQGGGSKVDGIAEALIKGRAMLQQMLSGAQ